MMVQIPPATYGAQPRIKKLTMRDLDALLVDPALQAANPVQYKMAKLREKHQYQTRGDANYCSDCGTLQPLGSDHSDAVCLCRLKAEAE